MFVVDGLGSFAACPEGAICSFVQEAFSQLVGLSASGRMADQGTFRSAGAGKAAGTQYYKHFAPPERGNRHS